MQVRIIEHYACAMGNFKIGSIIEVDNFRAERLVKDGVAEYLNQPRQARLRPVGVIANKPLPEPEEPLEIKLNGSFATKTISKGRKRK